MSVPYPTEAPSTRPLAAVDVDGVISLFGFRCAEEASERGDMHLIDGLPHCIARDAGSRLRRLGQVFELVWATGWEERANDHLPHLLGIPELPVLSFSMAPLADTAHWKLATITEHARGRPLAWIDDSLTEPCYEWAEARPEPTLLVPTESDRGIEEGHVEAMCSWAASGYTR